MTGSFNATAPRGQHESWRDDVDLARVAADPRSIAAGWLVVFIMIALGTIGPAVLPLVPGGHAAPIQGAAREVRQADVAARCAVSPAGEAPNGGRALGAWL
jgi:hypothetical protein